MHSDTLIYTYVCICSGLWIIKSSQTFGVESPEALCVQPGPWSGGASVW